MRLSFARSAVKQPAVSEPIGNLSSKADALYKILHNADENHVRIFDSVLEPRIYGQRHIMQEAEIMLAIPDAMLEVATTAQTLNKFTDHPHHPFVNFVKDHPRAKIITVNPSMAGDMIWGSKGHLFVQGPDYGWLFPKVHPHHTRVGRYLDQIMETKAPGLCP